MERRLRIEYFLLGITLFVLVGVGLIGVFTRYYILGPLSCILAGIFQLLFPRMAITASWFGNLDEDEKILMSEKNRKFLRMLGLPLIALGVILIYYMFQYNLI